MSPSLQLLFEMKQNHQLLCWWVLKQLKWRIPSLELQLQLSCFDIFYRDVNFWIFECFLTTADSQCFLIWVGNHIYAVRIKKSIFHCVIKKFMYVEVLDVESVATDQKCTRWTHNFCKKKWIFQKRPKDRGLTAFTFWVQIFYYYSCRV